MFEDLGAIAWDKALEQKEADKCFAERVEAITMEFKRSWMTLQSPGGSTTSYPLFGDLESRNSTIDKMAADLKVLLATGHFPR